MEYIDTIRDKDIFANPEYPEMDEYQERTTVKAVAVNDQSEYGFVTNPVHNCVLLAGGGAESDDFEAEIVRECNEELFYNVEVIKKIGVIKEFRNRKGAKYETTCYLVKAINEARDDTRTDDEKENALQAIWLNEEDALKTLRKQVEKVKKGEINFYNTAFNIVRDLRFFEEYLKQKNKSID